MTQSACHAADNSDQLTPRIILVFYHRVSGSVNDGYDIALQVMDVAVFDAVVFYKRRVMYYWYEQGWLYGG